MPRVRVLVIPPSTEAPEVALVEPTKEALDALVESCGPVEVPGVPNLVLWVNQSGDQNNCASVLASELLYGTAVLTGGSPKSPERIDDVPDGVVSLLTSV